MKEFWNQRYREATYSYGTAPNEFLADQLSKLPAGRILFTAEGEGRNAVYAARQGWEVVAFDYSEAGRDKALALAAAKGVSIDYRVADAAEVQFPPASFDAVGWIYTHLPAAITAPLFQRLLTALKPGGVLIAEVFNEGQLPYTSGGPKDTALLFSAERLRQECSGWQIDYLEEVITTLHEGEYHQGTASVTRMVARKP